MTAGHSDHEAAQALAELTGQIGPAAAANEDDVLGHLDLLTKPKGSLGRIEELALRLAVIVGDPPPTLHAPTMFVLAGDHGVTRHGVSAYPAEVTAQMCQNIAAGGAAISVFARSVGAEIVLADFGVRTPVDHPLVLDWNVRRGTSDFSNGPAMTLSEATRAIRAGSLLVREKIKQPQIIGLGEMGIGNSTAAAALTAALLDRPAVEVVGPGTGIESPRLEGKVEIVDTAVSRLASDAAPLEILAAVGGFEIAGLVGVALEAARLGIPVVIDGYISTAAALLAVRLAPATRGYLFASHRSAEQGHRLLLEALELSPLFDLEMRLGEGTGAALAFPILHASAALLREMATFSDAGVFTSTANAGGRGSRSP